ncbi:SEC-C domain-containing protein [Clostridium sp. JNZ X4-2]
MDFQKYDDIFNKDNYPEFEKIMISGEVTYVPKDDKPCICLSGQKYKDCCKKDIDETKKNRKVKDIKEELRQLYFQKDSKLISSKVEKKSVEKKNVSYCSACKIFGDCDTNNNNTRSHTLSRGNILQNLSGDGNDSVARFNDHKVADVENISDNISQYFTNVFIEDASVTVLFCKKHDVELFVDIETDGNTEYKKTDIQNLEYSLKAVSFDIYYKIMNISYMAKLINENRNVVYNYDGKYSSYFKDYYYAKKALFDIYPLMLKILSEIKDLKEKSVKPKLKSVCFELPVDKVNFSCSEVIYEWQTYCFVNVINSKKPYVIISYYEEDSFNKLNGLNELKSKFQSLNLNKKLQINCLSEFIIMLLMNAQNIYFNNEAFEKLSDEEKLYLYVVHREGTYEIPDQIQKNNNIKLMDVLFPI